jgi:osmotically-inducible protein OsmY
VKVAASDARADLELEEMIRTVLEWDALVPEANLSAEVLDGWVTLRGEAPTSRQREEASRAVRVMAWRPDMS